MWPMPACSIFIAEPFLNEYYTDLEFLMVFMNIYIYIYIYIYIFFFLNILL